MLSKYYPQLVNIGDFIISSVDKKFGVLWITILFPENQPFYGRIILQTENGQTYISIRDDYGRYIQDTVDGKFIRSHVAPYIKKLSSLNYKLRGKCFPACKNAKIINILTKLL